MRSIIFAVYISTFFLLNILQIKHIKSFNNDILFDYLSLNSLFMGLILFYFRYKSISLSLLTIFVMIFIIFIYTKDIKIKKLKTILLWFLIQNTYIFIYGTLRYFFF